MKKIAIVIYPEYSIQEIATLSALFRWYFEEKTVIFSSSKSPVKSEEGITILPEKSLDEFDREEYSCLVLPGCSDMRESIDDEVLFDFLESFKDEKEFVIAAIGSGPVYLSKAGILRGKRFTNSLFVEMNEEFSFIEKENLVYAPLVEDGNLLTAVGEAYREFAIALARKLGYTCPDHAYGGIKTDWKREDFMHHLPEEALEIFRKTFKQHLRRA